MTAFEHIIAETQPECTGVVETLGVSMGVTEMSSVQHRLMNTSEKDTLEVLSLILARPFNTTSKKRDS